MARRVANAAEVWDVGKPATEFGQAGGVAMGVLAVVGVVAFWMSIPIVFGGLALTLGLEGLRRDDRGRRGEARVAVALGAVAAVGGALLWLLGV